MVSLKRLSRNVRLVVDIKVVYMAHNQVVYHALHCKRKRKRVAPRRQHTSKALRYGTRSQEISRFYMHTPRSSADGMNHTCLCLPSRSWYSFTDPGGMDG